MGVQSGIQCILEWSVEERFLPHQLVCGGVEMRFRGFFELLYYFVLFVFDISRAYFGVVCYCFLVPIFTSKP